jgi:hypothetical protein
MTEQRPLVPEDMDEREAERRRRQEFVRRERARVVAGVTLETREQRLMWREKEIRALMTREFRRLSYGDSDLEIMPRVLAELLDLVTLNKCLGGSPASLTAARAPRAAMPPPLRRAWLRIFAVRCGLPCDPPVGGHSCDAGMIPRFHRAVSDSDPILGSLHPDCYGACCSAPAPGA